MEKGAIKINKIVMLPLISILLALNLLALDYDMSNNTMTMNITVASTRPLSIAFVDANILASDGNLKSFISLNNDSIASIYPVSENQYSSSIIHNFPSERIPSATDEDIVREVLDLVNFLNDLFKTANLNGGDYDRVIGIVDSGFFRNHMPSIPASGIAIPPTYSAIAEYGSDWYISAHELGHLYLLCDEYDSKEWFTENIIFSLGYGFECPNGDKDDDGDLDDECKNGADGCSAETFGIVVNQAGTDIVDDLTNFMGDDANSKVWINKESYLHLIKSMNSSDNYLPDLSLRTPLRRFVKAVVISGILFKNGTAKFDNFYTVNNVSGYNYSGVNGSHTIRCKTSNNQTTDYSIENDFFHMITSNGSMINTSITPINIIIPFNENITSIQMMFNETVIEERNKSANAPTIDVQNINNNYVYEEQFNISYTSFDIDYDSIIHAILISPDNGTTWSTLEIDYENTTYEIHANQFPYSDDYRIKILATDGFNTGENISNMFAMGIKPFSVRSLSETEAEGYQETLRFHLWNNQTSMSNITFNIDYGDNSSSDSTKFNLSKYESLITIIQHNYSDYGGYYATVNATGDYSDSKTLKICVAGSCGPYEPILKDLKYISYRYLAGIGFTIENNDTIPKEFQFNVTTSSMEVNSDIFNISSNSQMIIILEHNYSQAGNYDINITAQNDRLSSALDSQVMIQNLATVENLSVIESVDYYRAFYFSIINRISQNQLLNFTFDTGQSLLQSAIINLSDNIFVFVEKNYSPGNYTVNATIHEENYNDSQTMEIII